jgi:hypothetical protein
MNLSLRSASLVLVRLVQRLKSLQGPLRGWVPQPAPAVVPIPIRTDRSTRGPVSRYPYRGR